MRHLLVLSDVHLWEATDHDELWMRYRHRRFLPDKELAALLQRICAWVPAGSLEVVFNGDLFDFDIPPVLDGHIIPQLAPRTAGEALHRLRRILADHGLFLSALAQLLSRGHRLVFIPGNHDIQLCFPEVQAGLVSAILQMVPGSAEERAAVDPTGQIRFQLWYYQTPEGVHIEHGNQYDLYCSIPDPRSPVHRDGRLHTNAGSLVIEHLIGRLGYFNPNVESSFLLTTREYVSHWREYYSGSSRSLLRTFLIGSVRILWELITQYELPAARARLRAYRARAQPQEPSTEEAAHRALFRLPDAWAVARLLCMDRLVLLLGILTALGLAFLRPGLGSVLAAVLVLVGWWRGRKAQQNELGRVSEEVDARARAIARIHNAAAVVFGHTHRASGRWEAGCFFGNSGTWAPMYHDPHCSIRVEESRPFLWLHSDSAGALSGGLCRFQEGEILPVPGAYRRPPSPALPGAESRSAAVEHVPGGSFVSSARSCEPA
jgi:UDP-2,3-diacylglucosamine pyrophosphatase LpxH